MADLRVSGWKNLPVSLAELCLETTLRGGQSFRWKKLRDGEWYLKVPPFANSELIFYRSCALHGRILSLKQESTHLYYQSIWPKTSAPQNLSGEAAGQSSSEDEDEDTKALVKHYLNLTPDLTALYKNWSSVDPNFKNRAPKFAGVRILRQDTWESLVGFVCSSNNNIVRISQMVCPHLRYFGVI